MNKQELIDKLKNDLTAMSEIKEKKYEYDKGYERAIKEHLAMIAASDWPEKPVVPKFVADFYESIKDSFEWSLYSLCIDFHKRELQEDLFVWFKLGENKPIETLVKMKLYGYEVKKEKLYTVEIPNPNHEDRPILVKKRDGKVSIIFPSVPWWRTVKNAQLTEQEIKEDFEWAFRWAKEVK